MLKLKMEFVINKYFKNHVDHKLCLTMNDFTGFEGVLRRIDASHYLHLEDCVKFIEPRKLNSGFEKGKTILLGKMKIYCDDILGVEVKELVPTKTSTKKSVSVAEIRYLSLPYVSAFCRAHKKSCAVNKAVTLKQQELAKKEKEIFRGWSSFFDRLVSLDLTHFLRQNGVAPSPTKTLPNVQFGTYKKNASKHFRKRLVADYLNTVQEMNNLVQIINVSKNSRSKE